MQTESEPTPTTWPAKLRAAAHWFDLFDKLASHITVEENATEGKFLLAELISGTEIQDSLRELASLLEKDEVRLS